MKIKSNWLNSSYNFSSIPHHSSWDNDKKAELKMHKIHMYPAKFPSFLISKSLKYASDKNITISSIGDIFCGCGTTALEAKLNDKDFWGCDINPVATLIAKVKSQTYDINKLNQYQKLVYEKFAKLNPIVPKRYTDNERLKYWFHPSQIKLLYKLLKIIKTYIPKGKYQDFFLVAFSNILKGTSKWLTKSIKPQIDPDKPINDVIVAFSNQLDFMIRAAKELKSPLERTKTIISTENFLNYNIKQPLVDMLVTSPPYVTSYEYADLHQLSTLWLGYTSDYRTLRDGTIGSVYHKSITNIDVEKLNPIGKKIYDDLKRVKSNKSKSIAKYFLDLENTINQTYSLINPGGLAVFVIGNTKYNGIYIDNAKYLTKCLKDSGFANLEIFKRRISSKILSPYRSKNGTFSNDKRKRKVYSYEFVVIAKKNKSR